MVMGHFSSSFGDLISHTYSLLFLNKIFQTNQNQSYYQKNNYFRSTALRAKLTSKLPTWDKKRYQNLAKVLKSLE